MVIKMLSMSFVLPSYAESFGLCRAGELKLCP